MVVINVNVKRAIAYFHGKTLVSIAMNVLKAQMFAIKNARMLMGAIGVHVSKDIPKTQKQRNVFVSASITRTYYYWTLGSFR